MRFLQRLKTRLEEAELEKAAAVPVPAAAPAALPAQPAEPEPSQPAQPAQPVQPTPVSASTPMTFKGRVVSKFTNFVTGFPAAAYTFLLLCVFSVPLMAVVYSYKGVKWCVGLAVELQGGGKSLRVARGRYIVHRSFD